MTSLRRSAVALITLTTLLMAPAISAQGAAYTRVNGLIGDHVWVEAGPGMGAWQVTGTWNATIANQTGKAEFVASILGVRSDLHILNTGETPETTTRSPHTHHVALVDATVTYLTTGVRLTGTAIITSEGNAAPFSGSPVIVEITGGNTVKFSNMRLAFQGAAVGHFGSQTYDGVVSLER